jgi:abortive infection bacteriophage resistance protein
MSVAMLPPYSKAHLSFADQVSLLKGRGLTITDDWLAERHLARIGYYRLKDYWHPFRQTQRATRPDGSQYVQVLENFRPGTQFVHAVQLYVFDKKLRLLMTDAIERIEVALRVDVAHTLGHRSRLAHREPQHLDPKRAGAPQGGGLSRHDRWLQKANDAENRSKSEWIKEFNRTYARPLPIVMAVETWEFGMLSHLIEMAHPSDRQAISGRFGLSDSETLASWIRCLAYVRNVCAHHGRLWNHPLVNQPKLPKGNEAPLVAHIANYQKTRTRAYAAAAVAQHFMRIINPNSAWGDRLKQHWAAFPSVPGLSASDAGFMPAWQLDPLWN